MSATGETSSTQKPVVVRVKRKAGHSPLDAFWLEINERPFKQPLLNFSKLSFSSSDKKEDLKPKKVLVSHLETVADSETAVDDVIHSLLENDFNENGIRKGKFEERKVNFKKDNRKEQLLTKAVLQQQTTAQNARFKQIWRSRKKGNKDERCNFYDVIRVDDAEERTELTTSLEEDQKLLASFLPLLRENIPRAADEIEANNNIHCGYTEEEEYVYDFYAVKEEMEDSSSELQFPLVIVKEEEEEFCDGSDESDYDSDDSNAEDHPRNDYPEEISDDELEKEGEDEDEEEKSEASDDSKEEESSERHVRMVLEEDELDDYA